MLYFGCFAEGLIGSLLLWIFLPILLLELVCTMNIKRTRYGSVIFMFITSILIIHLTGVFDLVTLVTVNYIYLIIGLVIYFLLAFPYTRRVTWKDKLVSMYVYRNYKIEEIRERSNGRQEEFEALVKQFKLDKPINVLEHKATFVNMMCWWPFYLINKFFDKYIFGIFKRIKAIFNFILVRFMSKLQSDSEKEFNKSKKEDYISNNNDNDFGY